MIIGLKTVSPYEIPGFVQLKISGQGKAEAMIGTLREATETVTAIIDI